MKDDQGRSEVRKSSMERVRGWFRWTLVGFLADVIGIWGAIRAAQQPIISAIETSPISIPGEKVFGAFALSDIVIITLFLTVFLVVSVVYISIRESSLRNDRWPAIIGAFISAALVAFYFRLWLGENWWMWVCVAPALLLVMLALMLLLVLVAGIGESTGKAVVKSIEPATPLRQREPYPAKSLHNAPSRDANTERQLRVIRRPKEDQGILSKIWHELNQPVTPIKSVRTSETPETGEESEKDKAKQRKDDTSSWRLRR